MELLTKELLKVIPSLYSNEEKSADETIIVAHFFLHWDWYVIEDLLLRPDQYMEVTEAELDEN